MARSRSLVEVTMKKTIDNVLLFHTMNAANEVHANAPDGAWQAIIEECVTRWNEEHGTDYDENDTFHEWLDWRTGHQSDEEE